MSSKKAFFTCIDGIGEHVNANNLQIASIDYYQIIVGKDNYTGEEGILFLPDAIIKPEIVEKYNLNYLVKGRVKAVKLRGEISEGLFLPMSAQELAEYGTSEDLYTEYTKPVKQQKSSVGKFSNLSLDNFPKHENTEQYRNNKPVVRGSLLDPTIQVTFSVKVHGTSQRLARIQLPQEPNMLERVGMYLAGTVRLYTRYRKYLDAKYQGKKAKAYSIVMGSRNVILAKDEYNYRVKAAWFAHKLHKDEMVYYEILGYDDNGKPLMSPYQSKAYDYGIPVGSAAIQVYRITQNGYDLSPEHMEARCAELGVTPVRRLYSETVAEAFAASINQRHAVVTYPSTYNPGTGLSVTSFYEHTNEGLVIRIDNKGKAKFYKWKNREFLVEEGYNPPQIDGDTDES